MKDECPRCGKETIGDRGDDLCFCGTMDFDDYQHTAMMMAVYPHRGQGELMYPALGLSGETGEVANEIKKVFRDDAGRVTADRKEKLILEIGDVLWYVASLCHELGVSMEYVAERNLKKLRERKKNNTIAGSGDR